MAAPENTFYGWNIKDIARICGVDLTTARRWKRGARCPPKSAVLLISGDLGMFDRAWAGWIMRKDKLVSPEGWEMPVGEVRAIPLLRGQLAAYQSEVRQQRAALLMQEQPRPEDWPACNLKLGA